MESEFVFLDSTEFNSNSFNFESYKLKSLGSRGQKGTVRIVITDIVYKEVLNSLLNYIEKAHTDIKGLILSEKFRTIRHLIPESAKAVEDIDFELLKTRSKEQLDKFIKEAKIDIIDTGDVQVNDVLQLYFEKLPPFGESKKKNEFPDAISLIALRDWCKKTGNNIYIVSKDKDLTNLSHITNSFIELEDVGKFLEIVIEDEQQEKHEFDKFIRFFSDSHRQEIQDQIENVFLTNEFAASDYELDATFTDPEVLNVTILSSYVINADEERIVLDVRAKIEYQLRVKHLDYENAPYDSEDDRYIYVNSVAYTFQEKIIQEGTLEYEIISFPPQSWDDVLLQDSNLDPDFIEVDLEQVDRLNEMEIFD